MAPLNNYLLSFFFLYLSFIPSSFSDKLSTTVASTQIKFWYANVKNEMPAAISTKLSPLTKVDSDYYAKTISQINFKADAKFCSLAKLACSASLDRIPNQEKNYAAGAATRPNNEKNYAATRPNNEKNYAATRPNNEKNYAATTPNNEKNYAAGAAPTSLEKIDPFFFFRSSNLTEGDTMHLASLKVSIAHRSFLTPEIASKIPFTLKGVTNLFPDSPKDSIEATLSYCSDAPIKGEFKSCPKSLEEMINFSKFKLGASKLLALTSKNTAGSGKLLMIGKVKQFDVKKIVSCHEVFLPFATYVCHSVPSSRLYAVDLIEPMTRTPVNTALAVCHMDTSSWPEEHVAFKMLKFRRGQGEACHWMNDIDLAWIPDGDNI